MTHSLIIDILSTRSGHEEKARKIMAVVREAETRIYWKMIEDFQEMMVVEDLDRDTEINNKHLSYNDVEIYCYENMPKVTPTP